MSQTSFEEFYNPPSDYRVYRKPQPPRAYVLNVHRKKTMRAKSESVFPGPLEEALIKKDVMTYRYLRGDQEFGGSLTSISQQPQRPRKLVVKIKRPIKIIDLHTP